MRFLVPLFDCEIVSKNQKLYSNTIYKIENLNEGSLLVADCLTGQTFFFNINNVIFMFCPQQFQMKTSPHCLAELFL